MSLLQPLAATLALLPRMETILTSLRRQQGHPQQIASGIYVLLALMGFLSQPSEELHVPPGAQEEAGHEQRGDALGALVSEHQTGSRTRE